MKAYPRHNRRRVTAVIILFIVSLNALAAGYSFIIEPSGAGIGISLDYLRQSAPFRDYFIPGLILFSLIGIGGMFIAIMTMVHQSKYPTMLLLYGCLLIGWIAIQLLLVKSFHVLHLIIAVAGIILVAIGWTLKKAPTPRFRVFRAHDSN